MSIEAFDALLRHPAPAFACYACGDRQKREAFTARISHLARPSSSGAELDLIPSIPGADSARTFYQRYKSALLFTANGLMAAHGGVEEGLELFPLNEWASRTEETVDFWSDMDYPDDEMPYGRDDFVAIAHVHGASTYIHWVVRGPNAGQIYWWPTTMRPEANDPPLASSFAGFFDLFCTQSVHFLNDLLFSYTRYSDGTTATQWIPKRYIADVVSDGNPAAG